MALLRQTNACILLSAKKELNVATLDNIPGGVKMACGTVVLAILLWTTLQYGVEFGLMSPIDMQALRIPVALRPYKAYIDSLIGSPALYQQRSERSIQKRGRFLLPHVDDEAIKLSVKFSETHINRTSRMEKSLVGSNTRVRQETPQQGQLIESCPSAEALKHGKDALIATKASLYMSHKHCQWFGVDDDDCGNFIMTINMNSTSLGDKCAAQYNNNVECSSKYRSIDGSCNNVNHKAWGKAHTSYFRLLEPKYADGIQQPRKSVQGKSLVSARRVSSEMIQEKDVKDSFRTLSLVQWSEFIEHDLAHTPVAKMVHTPNSIMCCRQDGGNLAPRYIHPSCMPISVGNNDPFYSRYRQRCMNYVRSLTAMRPNCHFGPAEQMNQATHLLDGSMIYGTTEEKARSLRTLTNGQLSAELKNGHEYLPQADKPLQQCQVSSDTSPCYNSGDMRVNSHPQNTIMHTIWLREHNRVAENLALLNPHWDDEMLYQEARKIVIAEIQHITYNEWLPLVLGSKYTAKLGMQMKKSGFSKDFNEKVNPSISNSFATAGMRFRLSTMEGTIKLYNEDRTTNKTVLLRNHFNRPEVIEKPGYFDSLVRGLATQMSQKNDLYFKNDLTQMLYKQGGEFGMDAMSLDIQRGRDHGLPGYNHYRKLCGLPGAKSFDDFRDVMSKSRVDKLKNLYSHPDDVDLLIGGMAERPADDSMLGFTFRCIIGDQMVRTKKGDRFFYDVGLPHQSSFTEAQLNEIRKASLARVFCDNGDDIQTMQPNVFMKLSNSNELESCKRTDVIQKPSLSAWKEIEVKDS